MQKLIKPKCGIASKSFLGRSPIRKGIAFLFIVLSLCSVGKTSAMQKQVTRRARKALSSHIAKKPSSWTEWLRSFFSEASINAGKEFVRQHPFFSAAVAVVVSAFFSTAAAIGTAVCIVGKYVLEGVLSLFGWLSEVLGDLAAPVKALAELLQSVGMPKAAAFAASMLFFVVLIAILAASATAWIKAEMQEKKERGSSQERILGSLKERYEGRKPLRDQKSLAKKAFIGSFIVLIAAFFFARTGLFGHSGVTAKLKELDNVDDQIATIVFVENTKKATDEIDHFVAKRKKQQAFENPLIVPELAEPQENLRQPVIELQECESREQSKQSASPERYMGCEVVNPNDPVAKSVKAHILKQQKYVAAIGQKQSKLKGIKKRRSGKTKRRSGKKSKKKGEQTSPVNSINEQANVDQKA